DADSGFRRTANRHDYSLTPPAKTVLDAIKAAGKDVIGIGKIHDIFAGQGLTRTIRTKNNADGWQQTLAAADEPFDGLCFVNLVDFDMVHGHRRDVEGYTAALNETDAFLGQLLERLQDGDLVLLTADHGCDPAYRGTDHTREAVPLLIYGDRLKRGVNLGTRDTFADVGATVAAYLHVEAPAFGTSFLKELTI
ncbi:MAG: phosphopentomutase, partial [Clostridia bacterium]|nr:phosphopentomutase [Clostridia bacterium]